ncbi:unnamed protein product [Caenorhabditis bovis]|uniref:Major facilitator superfamily (MFS) profile domain-containing protein n=1 Tax=Caenorhabditis bovis TaxID=2654633 RepID=A0A8S1EG55_9PELO|nr:unnamed protein product [Caenorhabditis bovis]
MPCEKTSWSIVYLMGIFSLIQNTQYSIYLTTMFAYLKKLNHSATESQFGFIMATSSLGHCLGCFALGYWNSRTGKSAHSMYIGFSLMLSSNIVYLLVEVTPVGMVMPLMLISRLLGGFGMGNSSPMRTCASLHSTYSDRSKAMASLSGGRSVGTVIGPGLQLLFVPLGEQGVHLVGGLSIHSNNAPAFLGIALTLFGILSLIILFDESTHADSDEMAMCNDGGDLPHPDKIAMSICLLTRFVQNFMQISIETLAPAILMLMFLQSRQESVSSMATTYLITGLIATLLYLLIIFTALSKYVRHKIINVLVLFLFVAHLLATYPWQFLPNMGNVYSNETLTGCDFDKFTWCDGLTVPSEWLFYLGYIASFGLFMPFINVANATLYSKLLNPDCQGTHQSLYDISNTASRVFAPIVITTIYTLWGPRRAWEFIAIILLITATLWIIFDQRMMPIKPIEKTQFNENEAFKEEA